MLGRFVLGAANDKIGGKSSQLIAFSLLVCSLIWLQAVREAWMLFLFSVVYGFAHGGFFTVMSPTVAEVFGTGSHGLLFGIVLFFGTAGGAVGPVLAGRIFDVTGGYRLTFLILTLVAVSGFVLMALLRPLRNTNNGEGALRSGD